MDKIERLVRDLPDPDAARRFLGQLAESHPAQSAKLFKNEGLLSDILTLVSFSPLLATTLLQNPDYFWWLGRKRLDSGVRGKDELLESLARFALTNSRLDPQVLFARFRRRELLRIYLRDIRGLAAIAEITEEISNLADAILAFALGHARREMDNRFGMPHETDEKGRAVPSRFCIAALGKLGSKELNYSSDIDLIFLYSNEGNTSGVAASAATSATAGTLNSITNREYFVKLAEHIVRLIGAPSGEGAAYRVDLRLRPHGSLGALAMSVGDMVRYYRTDARAWERQVLIRSRGCAGDIELFKQFFSQVEDLIFSKSETVETALANVRQSKEKIDVENVNRRGFDVKLGRGGIREIEFLAQALQLAYGGRDKWLRGPHTLISLSRLADRKHLCDRELTELSDAYKFLRRTEHILQMENGIQTHTIFDDTEKREMLVRRMTYAAGGVFERDLKRHTENVSRIFSRVFGASVSTPPAFPVGTEKLRVESGEWREEKRQFAPFISPLSTLHSSVAAVSPHFAAMFAAHPEFAAELPDPDGEFTEPDYASEMMAAACEFRAPGSKSQVKDEDSELETRNLGPGTRNSAFGHRLSAMRQTWSRLMLGIAVADIFEKITIGEAKKLQTKLAEASIAAALQVVRDELAVGNVTGSDRVPGVRRQKNPVATAHGSDLGLAILALGKLGGRGLDYGSDLDLVIVHGGSVPPSLAAVRIDADAVTADASADRVDQKTAGTGLTPAEFYSRAVELFSTTLSSMTRDGSLYRVDLRLRPFGSKGLGSVSIDSFLGYMEDTAAIWEMLAFVKLRAVGGDMGLGQHVESETRRIIHERAAVVDPHELRDETRRVRLALEQKRTRRRRSGEIDIKYGPGGMLDVYFAMRYLQLRDNLPDEPDDRSTTFTLKRLHDGGSLKQKEFRDFSAGYEFLSAIDHHLRLTVGRTTRIPLANLTALTTIAARMKLTSATDLLEQLTLHRLSIRSAFEHVLG